MASREISWLVAIYFQNKQVHKTATKDCARAQSCGFMKTLLSDKAVNSTNIHISFSHLEYAGENADVDTTIKAY